MSELSFVNNVAAGVEKVGLRNAPLVYALAQVPWETVDDRDAVLNWIGEDIG